jgi:cysteinyl-tRNA synthetase
VGHLLDDGEDRILKGARLEQIEPMEVVQKYANGFHHIMSILNTERPSIEPRATGHIIEQIEMVQKILDNGFAYEQNGSVYFDTTKFAQETGVYGQLSGRVIEDLLSETRDNLKKQDEKKHPSDFAIWMKAAPEHIMKWNSPWSEGFPGWHLECSAMSTKYLGETFDIHGGGNDLKFPHHENEIAQNVSACSCSPARYWLHTNMLLLNGKKMSKSDGNTISPQQLFSGENDIMTKAYSPMVVKFFMLQSHYRSTLDLTDEALQAAEKGYRRLMEGYRTLQQLEGAKENSDSNIDQDIKRLLEIIQTDMCDDFNTPKALAGLFELVTKVNALKSGNLSIQEVSVTTLHNALELMHDFIFHIFGLTDETSTAQNGGPIDGLMELVLELRKEARENKNWSTADKIRDGLKALEIQIKDGKEGTTWSLN